MTIKSINSEEISLTSNNLLLMSFTLIQTYQKVLICVLKFICESLKSNLSLLIIYLRFRIFINYFTVVSSLIHIWNIGFDRMVRRKFLNGVGGSQSQLPLSQV